MRIDKSLVDALTDPRDLRGALLSATRRERSAIETLLATHDPDAAGGDVTPALEALAEATLPRSRKGEDLPARIARWAVAEFGGQIEPRPDLEALDKALLDLARSKGMDAAAKKTPADRRSTLLRIAVLLAGLRQRKLGRLRMWGRLLDWIGPAPEKTPRTIEAASDAAVMAQSGGNASGPSGLILESLKDAAHKLPIGVWEEKLKEARKDLGRFNIIVAGRTGVGKTTLIGAIFGTEVGNTLMGRPRTRGRIWYPEQPGEADVLRLCDTEGLELERYRETLDGLKKEIDTRNASRDAFDHIHVAWLCIDEPSLTVQPGEEELVKLLSEQGIPVIAVLTKAGMAPAFKETVARLLPAAKHVVRVRAAPIVIEGQQFAPIGLDELMQVTEEVIPTAVEKAWHVASRNLAAMVRRAEKTVNGAAAGAGAAGAAPIPLADAAGVFGIQVGMIAAVSLQMGVRLKREDLRVMAVTLIGALGLTAGGRFLAGQVIKFLPGIGTVAGSAITGSTAAALTYGLGRAYIEYLRGFYEKNGRMPAPEELVSGFQAYWKRWKARELPDA